MNRKPTELEVQKKQARKLHFFRDLIRGSLALVHISDDFCPEMPAKWLSTMDYAGYC